MEKAQKYALDARNLILSTRIGILSTISTSNAGYPFGSVTPYDVAPTGDLIIYVSLLAEHYKNLIADSRASLIVADPYAGNDAQAAARATILTRFTVIPRDEEEPVRRAYEARFPRSINYEIAHNFLFMRGVPEKIRWIGGFGDIAWVSATDYQNAAPDPLAHAALDIIEHMNTDHADALRDYVRAFSAFDPEKYQIQMVGVSSAGFTLALRGHEKRELVTIPFDAPVSTSDEVRSAMITLIKTSLPH